MLFVFAFFIPSPSAGEITISVTEKTGNLSHSASGIKDLSEVKSAYKLTFQPNQAVRVGSDLTCAGHMTEFTNSDG